MCNNSSTKAPIFMKFEIYAHKLVVYHQTNFREDSQILTRAKGINVRTRVSSRLRTCARAEGESLQKIL